MKKVTVKQAKNILIKHKFIVIVVSAFLLGAVCGYMYSENHKKNNPGALFKDAFKSLEIK